MATAFSETLPARYYRLRLLVFNRVQEYSTARKIAMSAGMAMLTGICAQVRIPLPWTPVPVTAQTFAVLVCGLVLGRKWGGLSQLIYLALGAAGIGWFSGFAGGAVYLAGPTGGYLAGFIPAAVFIGHFAGTRPGSRYFIPMLLLMFFANFALIYGPGLIQLSLWMQRSSPELFSIRALLAAGLLPFIPGDIAKIALASLAAKALLPKGDRG